MTYTPAFGYQADKVQKLEQVSIGYKNFKLASDDSEDAWGRPTTKWYKDSDKDLKFDSFEDTYAEVTATPKATFNVETSQCDICEALGVKKTTTVVDTYTNGKLDTKDVTYTATATKAMVGAQGEQIEFYQNADGDYRLVVIDTSRLRQRGCYREDRQQEPHYPRRLHEPRRLQDLQRSRYPLCQWQ